MTITLEQLEYRKGKIGGSDVAAALGVSPWQTPAQLAAVLLGRIEKEDIGLPGRIGNLVEPTLAAIYREVTGRNIVQSNTTLQHPDYEWLVAHPDYFDQQDIVEFKAVGPWTALQWGKEDADPNEAVPFYVQAQCAVQALLWGKSNTVHIGAYFGGGDFRVYTLEFSPSTYKVILDKLVYFWEEYIEKGRIPEFTEMDVDLIKAMYWKHTLGEEMVADEELEIVSRQIYKFKEKIKADGKELAKLEAELKGKMLDAECLKDGEDNILFTWKQNKDGEKTDWKGISGELGKAVEQKKYDGLIKDFTKPTRGARPLCCKIKPAKEVTNDNQG